MSYQAASMRERNCPASSDRYTDSTASIPVLPVTVTLSGEKPSRSRLSAAHWVAAKCKLRQAVRERSIALLWEGGKQVVSSQSGLYVRNRHAAVEACERPTKSAAWCHPEPLSMQGERFQTQAQDQPIVAKTEAVRRLARRHHVQIEIRLDIECVQHLMQHLPMLAGDADRTLKGNRPSRRAEMRGHKLYSLRACSEDNQHALFIGSSPRGGIYLCR